MMKEEQRVASRVLDYWYSIEFLGQDSYETCTEATKLTRELKSFKTSDAQKKSRRKQLPIYTLLDGQANIYSLLSREAKECGMKTWGNLTFYIGRVKRQSCIESLAGQLKTAKLDQAEKSTDDIAILSFQCDQKGIYVRHSLSLSTIIWALSQVTDLQDAQISETLSEKAYWADVNDLERRFFGDDTQSSTVRVDLSSENHGEELPRFDADAITIERIDEIQQKIVELYNEFLSGDTIDPIAGMRFQLFKDSKAKERNDDDNCMGLSHDFFSKDLKMVKESIEADFQDFSQGILSELLEYICAPYNQFANWDRHDLVKPTDKDAFAGELLDILNIRNAPLGKWPSRYMPSLMQQVAINFALSNTEQGVLGKGGKIFSVNGPPGTGKTTLLKEVIAGSVVEKARLLSQYDTPDDAFEGHRFWGGDKNGAYSKYYPNWYSFRDDHIGDYGILVTSCNNAAVENITKELPLSGGVINQLKTNSGEDNPDSAEMQEQLREVQALFSTSHPTKTAHLYTKDSKRDGIYSEVYFTGYASKLLGSDDKDADAWGLIAAPLGRKSNINAFYYDVLNPLWQDFLIKNQYIEDRLGQYQAVRDKFIEQLRIVEQLRNELADSADCAQKAWAASCHYREIKSRNESETAKINTELGRLQAQIREADCAVNSCQAERESASALVNHCFQQLQSQQSKFREAMDKETELKRKALEAEKSVSIFTKFIRPSKFRAATDLAKSYSFQAKECNDVANRQAVDVRLAETAFNAAQSKLTAAEERLRAEQHFSENLRHRAKQLNEVLYQLQCEIYAAENEAQACADAWKLRFNHIQNRSETDQESVIDADLVSDILSDDEERSTRAQLVNPWVTQHYNREREKLFYWALQLSKEFILSSKCCRANLCILGQYWGLKPGDDGSPIFFHEEDRLAMASSLLQTLFLLTPVISSTFASVGRLLKDITEPGSIGTLIIDEAGQAQPQMAVGAIYRSRRAIIVGDPKQVEPVVTDDLNLLKQAYSDPIYSSYKDKALSAQRCADIINPFGTFFDNGTDYPDWVGCPLLVHRRCISPMYDISNQISYSGMMKQRTLPPSEQKSAVFLLRASQWINVVGTEAGQGNHYVPAQGKEVCQLVNTAFERADYPNLYIIAPFTTVVSGIQKELIQRAEQDENSALAKKRRYLSNWIYSNIGTVHKFQGKEADEVIFLLGCDRSQREKYAVAGFVNSNLVNVAVTRAKYRLYVVGDAQVWERNPYVREAKTIMDTLAIKAIAEIEALPIPNEEKQEKILAQAARLPSAASFTSQAGVNDHGEPEFQIHSDDFIASILSSGFLNQELSAEQFRQFGFTSKEEFNSLSDDVKKNLLMGMKLYFLLRPIYQLSNDLDASCCGILFCKAAELQLRNNFAGGLKRTLPDYTIRPGARSPIPLKDAADTDFMIGTIHYILDKNIPALAARMNCMGEAGYTESWWKSFADKLASFAKKRNQCCHPQPFQWEDLEKLLAFGFESGADPLEKDSQIGGIFYESAAGKKLVET